jgi:hypothetical protein
MTIFTREGEQEKYFSSFCLELYVELYGGIEMIEFLEIN